MTGIEARKKRVGVSWLLRTLAYGIPLVLLAYVLYVNFLPFGYHETFVIDVGTAGDRDGEFSLEALEGMSERKIDSDRTTYREISGFAYAVFRPRAILRHAKATVSVIGTNIEVIPANFAFDPGSATWDHMWDFRTAIPHELVGQASVESGCVAFDATHSLRLPAAVDRVDQGSLAIYTAWTPTDPTNDFQQIVGDKGWRLLQNKRDVEFQVVTGAAATDRYVIEYPIDERFFGTSHTAFATYASATSDRAAYIDLYVDERFAGRTYLVSGAERIQDPGFTLGTSTAPEARPYIGCVRELRIASREVVTAEDKRTFAITAAAHAYPIALISTVPTGSRLNSVTLDVVQD